jgi:hypothetical protein
VTAREVREAFTPGPWRIGFGATNDGQRYIMAGSGDEHRRVALVDRQSDYKRGKGHEGECPERDANARLIASAPQLVEALRTIATRATGTDPEFRMTQVRELARAALAAACGEP